MLRTALVGVAFLVLCSGAASTAGAQQAEEDDAGRAGARALFTQGLELAQRRQFEQAMRLFRAARALHVAPAIDYNLASALFELDLLTEAGLLVDGVLDSSETPENVIEPARDLKRRIRERGGRVEVLYRGGLEGVEVDVDGQRIPRFRIGGEVVVTAGPRVVVAYRDGAEVDREEVQVESGQKVTVTLDLAPRASDVAQQQQQQEQAAHVVETEPTLLEDWRFWAIVGAGVAVAALVVVLALAVDVGFEDPIEGNFEPGVIRWD